MRVESDCLDIIRKYSKGGSVTDGVREMEKLINKQPVPNTLVSSTAWIPGSNLEAGMSPEYWKRLREELDKVIKNYSGG